MRLKQNTVGVGVISSYDYTVNAIGQRTGVEKLGNAFASSRDIIWGYDVLGQVVKADSSETGFDCVYEYDGIGNRKKSANSLTLPGSDNYTANALNQYIAVASLTPSYDEDGNATNYPLPANPGTNSILTWDGENRLTSTTVNGTTTTYLYDASSRRIAQTTGTATMVYLYDAWNPVAEYSWSGGVSPTLEKSYTWGLDLSGTLQGAGGVGGLLSVTDHRSLPTDHYYPTYDGNGNISEYLDGSGTTVAHYEYDPFGRNRVADGAKAGDFAHRFSTKLLDQAAGLYYYGYRYYDPVTGRWPSRDPIEENGGINLYGFVGNRGIDLFDVLGYGWYDDIKDYFKEIPGATKPCFGEAAGDIILSISIVPYEEIASGDIKSIAAGALINRIPGAKCGIQNAKKLEVFSGNKINVFRK